MQASSLNEGDSKEAFWSPAISLSSLEEQLMGDRNSPSYLDAAVSVFQSTPAAASSPLESSYTGLREPATSPGVENSTCSASTSHSLWGQEHGAVAKAAESLQEDKSSVEFDGTKWPHELEASTMQMPAPHRVGLEPITVRPLPILPTPFGAARPASSLPACRFGLGNGNTASRQHLLTSSPLSTPTPRIWPQHDAQAWMQPNLHRSHISSGLVPTEDHSRRSGRESIKQQPQQLKRRRSRSLPPDLGFDDMGMREQLLPAQRFSDSPVAPSPVAQRAPIDRSPDFAMPLRQASRSLPDLTSFMRPRRSLPPCKVFLRQEDWHKSSSMPSSLSRGLLPQRQPVAPQSAILPPRMIPGDQQQGTGAVDILAGALPAHGHLAAIYPENVTVTHPESVIAASQSMSWQEDVGGPVIVGTFHLPIRQGGNDLQPDHADHAQHSVHINVKAPVILEQKWQQQEGHSADGGADVSLPPLQEFNSAANRHDDDVQAAKVIAGDDAIHLWQDASLELPDLDAVGSDQDGNQEGPLDSSEKDDFLAFVSELGLF